MADCSFWRLLSGCSYTAISALMIDCVFNPETRPEKLIGPLTISPSPSSRRVDRYRRVALWVGHAKRAGLGGGHPEPNRPWGCPPRVSVLLCFLFRPHAPCPSGDEGRAWTRGA